MGVLVEAAYHSDPNIASQKWECWKPNNLDLDTIDWQTARLLAQAATILSSRGIESTNLATQKVIKRFEWALGENQLQNVRPLLNASAQAGIPIMVFKGAAMHLSGFADGAPRLMADIDILIEPAQIDNVMDVAEGLGWKSKRPLSRTAIREDLLSSRHSTPLTNGGKSEIDLHTSAFLLNRCPDHDAMMWARSTEARFGDVHVLVPSALD
ncbi:MAG: nucleotidyltransferase family protein, partial [Gammaproteobacteria bacterium]|nr:nucleotidyltransferase family protein [Gammaproteobacteria bacterium]